VLYVLCISVYPRLYSGAVFHTGSFIVFLYRNSKRGVFRKSVVAHAELLSVVTSQRLVKFMWKSLLCLT
jgi:hypothetical protein